MKSTIKSPSLAALAGIALTSPAFAVVNIDYVSVGHAGNAADSSGYGAVAYAYNISKHEVTNAQYTEFLNTVDSSGANAAGLYNGNMGADGRGGISFNAGAVNGAKYTIRSSMGDKPVNFVSWNSAARFTNWLHNGQGSGSTETGSYTMSLGGATRNVGATVFLPNENEWYKAAYYDPTTGAGGGDNYWTYATQSNTAPTVASADTSGDVSNPGANVVNFGSAAGWNSQIGNVTTVGSAAANNYFGTTDMSGNVSEWIEGSSGSTRVIRGGAWSGGALTQISSIERGTPSASTLQNNLGFRVAAIPEPSACLLSVLAVCASLIRRRRH